VKVAALPTIAVRIYDALAAEIIAGELVPGRKLDERELAARFGASRTPIREALLRLQERGLVANMPRRGVVVAEISLERLAMLLEAQCEIEGLCARRATEAMTAMERKELEMLHEQSAYHAHAGDHAGYLRANDEFHDLIARGTHNDVLVSTLIDLRDRLAPFRRAQSDVEDRLELAHGEHDAVVRAMLAGQPEAAFNAMRDHDARLSTHVLRVIRSRAVAVA
jgi:DNA-binding GntR family transcriptional regulator